MEATVGVTAGASSPPRPTPAGGAAPARRRAADAFPVLLGALALGVVADRLFYGQWPGLAVPLFVALLLGALALLARLEGARNRPGQGLPPARRAAELAPNNPEAWLVLARLAIDARDAATAESALQRVDALIGRSHPLVVQTWEMLARLKGQG